MLYPSINDLRDKVDSKYTLVILAAKRARDLIDGKCPLVDIGFSKPVSIATQEIADDIITYRRDDGTEEPEFSEEEAAEEMSAVSDVIEPPVTELVGEEPSETEE